MKLGTLVEQFWVWTGLPRDKWGVQDIGKLDTPAEEFPRLFQMQRACIERINTTLSEKEMEDFLTCMAVDNEDEEILDACKDGGSVSFLAGLVRAGLTHRQPMARWQAAELLRWEIPGGAEALEKFRQDPDPYVRRRAEQIWKDRTGGQDGRRKP